MYGMKLDNYNRSAVLHTIGRGSQRQESNASLKLVQSSKHSTVQGGRST